MNEQPYEFYRDPVDIRMAAEYEKHWGSNALEAQGVRFSPAIRACEMGKPLLDTSRERKFLPETYDGERGVPVTKRKAKGGNKTSSNKNNVVMNMIAEQKPKEETKLQATSHPQHGLGTIQSTNQYHLFKQLDANRKVNEQHVKNLMREIRKKNLLHLRPITVDANMCVIDGQHRLEAAKRLGVAIHYTKDDTVREEDIAGLNTHQRNWGVDDYLHFYANKGVYEYQQFLTFAACYPHLSTTMLLPIVSSTGNRNANAVRSGMLDIGNLDKARDLLEQLESFKPYTPLYQASRFVEAFTTLALHPEYDHKRLLAKVAADPGAIVPSPNKKGFIHILQQLYNKGVREQNIVFFVKR